MNEEEMATPSGKRHFIAAVVKQPPYVKEEAAGGR
jgi:hypothetical protein